MKYINDQFCANSSLQLNDFIRPDLAYKLTKALVVADETQRCGHGEPQLNYTLGASAVWELVGPPHKRRHLMYASSDAAAAPTTGKSAKDDTTALSDAVGAQLDAIRREVFRSAVFAKYLQVVTALEPLGYKDEVRRFRPGLDYTVAHYGVLTKQPRLDATLCFVNDDLEVQERVLAEHRGEKPPKAAAKPVKKAATTEEEGSDDEGEEQEEEEEEEDYEDMWEGGEVGGFECYIEAEEDPENAEAAEVYRTSYNRENVVVGKGAGKKGKRRSVLFTLCCTQGAARG
jgi:hypothetical protein